MIIRLQDEEGSAEAATSPSHGSNHSHEEKTVNNRMGNIPAAATARGDFSAFLDLENVVNDARDFANLASYLAAEMLTAELGVPTVEITLHEARLLRFMTREAAEAADRMLSGFYAGNDTIGNARRAPETMR